MRKIIFFAVAVAIGSVGCGLFSGDRGDAEAVFAATEVGTPEGPSITKNIGPDGGSLTSPDGRLTLTIPPTALTETLLFSIQPITNKTGNGLGLAYRLGPDGKTFTIPVDVTVHYDDTDLEGTVPEALSIAYQDKLGAWRALKKAKLDQAAKTFTISTTHFTDYAFLARLRLKPVKASVFVGETQPIILLDCREQGWLDRVLSRPAECGPSFRGRESWDLSGKGSIDRVPPGNSVIYTAPATKPDPNYALVKLDIVFEMWDAQTGDVEYVSRTFISKITIVDRGYKATGQTADTTYSGLICSLDAPFTVTASNRAISYPFNFVPVPESGGGSVTFGATIPMLKVVGSGKYTLEGIETETPRIAMTAGSTGDTAVGSRSGGGTVYIDLVPLQTDECTHH